VKPWLFALALAGACLAGVPLPPLPPGAELQGHGFLDGSTVFYAYSGDGEGGASTVLALYDVNARRSRVICELGATGESTFAVNRTRRMVAFNWIHGIYLTETLTPMPCGEWEQRLRLLVRCDSCYEVAWRDDRTLTYQEAGVTRTVAVD
jgi:hypothetical protein